MFPIKWKMTPNFSPQMVEIIPPINWNGYSQIHSNCLWKILNFHLLLLHFGLQFHLIEDIIIIFRVSFNFLEVENFGGQISDELGMAIQFIWGVHLILSRFISIKSYMHLKIYYPPVLKAGIPVYNKRPVGESWNNYSYSRVNFSFILYRYFKELKIKKEFLKDYDYITLAPTLKLPYWYA